MEAQALVRTSTASQAELAEALVALGAPAAIVTGGHGDEPVDHLFDGREHLEIPVERHDVAATHGAGCTHSATLAALLARGLSLLDAARGAADAASRAVAQGLAEIGAGDGPGRRPRGGGAMSISPGTTLRELRERKPLVHQITNYVVMNETANATLALGALPVMAHAPEEVEEMARPRLGARPQHRHALGALGRGDAARRRARRARAGSPSCSIRSAPARPRTARERRGGSSTRST